MYKRDKRRSAALYIGGGLALAVGLALILFLLWSMHLRNSYRDMCLEINDAILAVPAESCTVGRDGESYPADRALLDYFDRFLLNEGVMPFSRRPQKTTDRTIYLSIGENQLLLTGLEDNTAVHIQWITPDGTQAYTVRTTRSTFSQLNAFYVNYKNRLTQ